MKLVFCIVMISLVSVSMARPCDDEPWASKPWCDVSKPFDERAKLLIKEMTLEEKVSLLGNDNKAIERLNLEDYQWWNEALHGVACSPGVQFRDKTPFAVSFPQVSLTAQSFDRKLFHEIAVAISDEARVMANAGNAYLTYWTPNVNIYRDPRWGRGQETPGEDPYLTSTYAAEFVRGMQEGEDPRYMKVSSCCKHYSAYDLENWHGVDRFHFDAKVTDRDMQDTYQPPFESCVKKGRASSLMCSYNAINGIPACADKELLYGTARDSWGFEGYITSDCGAIDVIENSHFYTNNTDDTVRYALDATCDIDCGGYYQAHIVAAVKDGSLDEKLVDNALVNLIKVQMRLGMFDPADKQIYTKYGLDKLNTPENQQLALRAAREGIALLKNKDNRMPYALKGKKIAIVGPFATDGGVFLGNYNGIPQFIINVADGIKKFAEDVTVVDACTKECGEEDIKKLIEGISGAELIVAAIGLHQDDEREGWDRENLLLNEVQRKLMETVLANTNGDVIITLFSGGGSVDIHEYEENDKVIGLLAVGYSGMMGGQAIAEIINGDVNPSGRLVNTMYYDDYVTNLDYFDMRMRAFPEENYPGRTYRFYEGPVIHPFGFGLSYTTFAHKIEVTKKPQHYLLRYTHSQIHVEFNVNVKNTGDRDGAESILVFAKSPMAGKDGYPLKVLVAYDRVNLAAGEETVRKFNIGYEELRLVDPDVKYQILKGTWTLEVEEASATFDI